MGLTIAHREEKEFVPKANNQPRKDEKQTLMKGVWKLDLTMATLSVGAKIEQWMGKVRDRERGRPIVGEVRGHRRCTA